MLTLALSLTFAVALTLTMTVTDLSISLTLTLTLPLISDQAYAKAWLAAQSVPVCNPSADPLPRLTPKP